MKRSNLHILLALLPMLIINSCTKDSDGDNYTPAKRISLGEVSIMIPETFAASSTDANSITYDNDFGGGSVEIIREDLNGRTEEAVFQSRTDSYTYLESKSNTNLLGHNALVVEESIGGIHRIVHYVFIHNNSVYILDFSWTIEKEVNSRQSMNDMLATLIIG